MKPFDWNLLKEEGFLCIECQQDNPDISLLAGYGGSKSGTRRYYKHEAVDSDYVFGCRDLENKDYLVFFQKDINEKGEYSVKPDFWNPFGLLVKLMHCEESDLPLKISWRQKIINFFTPSARKQAAL